MADIEAERAWLRQHGTRQRFEDAEAEAQRWADEKARGERTCPYCFHGRHEHRIAAFSLSPDLTTATQHGPESVTVFYCREDECACGVPPCAQCGSRERVPNATTHHRHFGEIPVERCTGCGAEWQMSPIA